LFPFEIKDEFLTVFSPTDRYPYFTADFKGTGKEALTRIQDLLQDSSEHRGFAPSGGLRFRVNQFSNPSLLKNLNNFYQIELAFVNKFFIHINLSFALD
jgi:hypothetical protein